MFGHQAVQSVVIFVVDGSFCHPVHQSLGQDGGEPSNDSHVHRKTTAGGPASHPSPLACAEERLVGIRRGKLGVCVL